jgi:hypothetical protein
MQIYHLATLMYAHRVIQFSKKILAYLSICKLVGETYM